MSESGLAGAADESARPSRQHISANDVRELPPVRALYALPNRLLNGNARLFGVPVRLDGQIRFDSDDRLRGGLDVVVPLGAGPGPGTLGHGPALFLQPGFMVWEDDLGDTRQDLNLGLVVRFALPGPGETVGGVGVFADYGLNSKLTRASVGADLQLHGLYSAVNWYQPLSGWRESPDVAFEERPLKGFDLNVELPVPGLERLHVGASARRFWGEGQPTNAFSRSVGLRLGYALTDTMTLQFSGLRDDDGDERFDLGLRLTWPGRGAAAAGTVRADPYRTFEREKRILVARRLSANLTLALSASEIAENGGSAQLTATLDGPLPSDVNLQVGVDGSATRDLDYRIDSSTLTIPAGATSATVRVTALSDSLLEGDETVVFHVAGVSLPGVVAGGTPPVMTIVDGGSAAVPVLTLSAGADFPEAGGSTSVTATLSTPAPTDVSVALDFAGGAQSGDYQASSTTIVIPAGVGSASLTLTGVDDALPEGDETIVVSVASVTGATDGSSPQTVTVTDDDVPTVSLSSGSTSVAENGGPVTFTAALTAAAAGPITVNLGYAGTATGGGVDYAAPASLVIPAGQLSASFSVSPTTDALYELGGTETVIVSLASVSGGLASLDTTPQTVSISDTDTVPTVTVFTNGAVGIEGDTMAYRATLSHASVQAVTGEVLFEPFGVNAFAHASADASDINVSTASFTIPAGSTQSTETLTFSLADDTSFESVSPERVGFTLQNVVNATSAYPANAAYLGVMDNDPDPARVCLNGGTAVRIIETLRSGALSDGGTQCQCAAGFTGSSCELVAP